MGIERPAGSGGFGDVTDVTLQSAQACKFFWMMEAGGCIDARAVK